MPRLVVVRDDHQEYKNAPRNPNTTDNTITPPTSAGLKEFLRSLLILVVFDVLVIRLKKIC